MGKELDKIRRRGKTKSKMEEIFANSSNALVIHYSCESFVDKEDGRSPRITSIGIRNLESGQTNSFSIHSKFEEKGIDASEIPSQYNVLEKEMLDDYFVFVNRHQHFTWIHWNMRDANYGFVAIEHRYKVLKGIPIQISEDRKFDLSRALVSLYGKGYIGHPRLENLIKKNKITDQDFLKGAEEAVAFEKGEYLKLHRSTLRKIDNLANIFEQAHGKSLAVNSSFWEIHGISIKVTIEYIKEHWVISLLSVLGIIAMFILRAYDLINLFTNKHP